MLGIAQASVPTAMYSRVYLGSYMTPGRNERDDNQIAVRARRITLSHR
jgi:hypothetical protein